MIAQRLELCLSITACFDFRISLKRRQKSVISTKAMSELVSGK